MDIEMDIDLGAAVEQMAANAATALQAGGEALAEAANEIAPRDQGDLAGSVEVEADDEQASVAYTATDEAGFPYPSVVHEKWDPWLATAVDQSHDRVAQAVRDELQL